MAAKRPYRALDAFLTRCRTVPANVSSISYDPSTGAVSASFHKSPAEQKPEQTALCGHPSKDGGRLCPSCIDEANEQDAAPEDEPIDFRFALERFNDSPKPRQRQ